MDLFYRLVKVCISAGVFFAIGKEQGCIKKEPVAPGFSQIRSPVEGTP